MYSQALANNPVLKARLLEVDIAESQIGQQRSKLRPQVSALANYGLNRFDARGANGSTYEGSRASLQLRQALYDRASALRVDSARAIEQQTRQEAEAVQMQLAVDVVDRYLLALEGEDQIGYVKTERGLTEQQLQRLRVMVDRQMAKVTDLYEVEAYLQGLATKEIDARNARAVALEKLREITGVAVAQVNRLTADTYAIAPHDVEAWTNDAAQHNPALIGLRFAADAAKQAIASINAEARPRLDLVMSETYANTGFDNAATPRYRVGTLGLQLTVPIYEGGRVDAGAREAVARHGIAEQQYEQKRREIEREVRTAHLRTTAENARIQSTSQEVQALEKTRAALEKGYELRVNTIVDLLDAQRRVFKARTEQSKARYDYVRALVELRVWAGVLDQAEMQKVNAWFSTASGSR